MSNLLDSYFVFRPPEFSYNRQETQDYLSTLAKAAFHGFTLSEGPFTPEVADDIDREWQSLTNLDLREAIGHFEEGLTFISNPEQQRLWEEYLAITKSLTNEAIMGLDGHPTDLSIQDMNYVLGPNDSLSSSDINYYQKPGSQIPVDI